MPVDEFNRRLTERDFSDAFAIKDEQFKQLANVDLAGANFERAQIKGCPLHSVILRGANCASANFTLSDFAKADLREVNFVGCDLEGTNLRNADLRGADLRGASLTAAKFDNMHYPAKIRDSRFSRSNVENEGVNSREQAFLLDPKQGASIE